jgi:hypothetical protein
MEQNKKHRHKSVTNNPKIYHGEKTASSTNVGKTISACRRLKLEPVFTLYKYQSKVDQRP